MKFIKNNSKLLIGIIIGMVLSGTTVYAATQIMASDVLYDNTNSGLTSTNVQAAVDELTTRANTWIDPSILNGKGYYINTARSIIATSGGILLIRGGQTHFIKSDNWSVEKDHIQQIFTGENDKCSIQSELISCYNSDFDCTVCSDGYVECTDYTNGGVSYCGVEGDGSLDCD